MLAVDMPFHGKTSWQEGLEFSPQQLLEILAQIIGPAWDRPIRICLLGYSMGGRIGLALLPLMAARVERIILLAPDGLTLSPWYWLATQTRPGNLLFRYTMRHPAWFFRMLQIAHRMGLVNLSIQKFVNIYIGDKVLRENLYLRWTVMRHFRPDLRRIKSLIRQQHIRVKLLYGIYDRIIRPERGEAFGQGIENLCELLRIESGHQLLHAKQLQIILQWLKD